MLDVVFIGAGNVATHLAIALYRKGMHIRQVYSRTSNSAQALAEQVGATYTTTKSDIYTQASIYICGIKDSEISSALTHIDFQNNLLVHTAGSVDIEILSPFSANYGVLYPLQTFSISKAVDWEKCTLFIEANNRKNTDSLIQIASLLSPKVKTIDSEERRKLHIAAVFACNFTNHLYTLASELMSESGGNFEDLLPLIQETTDKLRTLSPYQAQTGPAVRQDTRIVATHIAQLAKTDSNKAAIYTLLSESIMQTNKKRTENE
jgi:predicted short-subunit dehydrogenase-like oxidoreductase (DUF2520 family)